MGKNAVRIEGYWKFDKAINNTILDRSGNNHELMITGKPSLLKENKLEGGISLDGSTQWLSTKKPVIHTDQSYSIAAWVYLDSSVMNEKLLLRKAEHSFALTAVSQDSPTHCAFYLGIRRIEWLLPDGTPTGELRWSFTVAPVDGSETAVLVWEHAYSTTHLNAHLDKWVLLVGVCDVEKRATYLYVPSINEAGAAYMPDAWTFWHADGGIQIGRARWLGRNVDQWPGKIGPVRVFSGVLNDKDAKRLYFEDTQILSPS